MHTILGSGFGLYGYLPALVRELNEEVTLPVAYRSTLEARPELAELSGRVVWLADRDACLRASDAVVVCLPPAAQARVGRELAQMAHVRTVVLEKPVASDPAQAEQVFEALVAAHKSVVVNYSFLYTTWHERFGALLRHTGAGTTLSVAWTFRAHHFRQDVDNWKRTPADGGGVLRFYGIHVIALLASVGYAHVRGSALRASGSAPEAIWDANFSKPNAPRVAVRVDSNCAEARFTLRSEDPAAHPFEIDLDDPFSDAAFVPRRPADDRRIPHIARLLRSAAGADEQRTFYRAVNALWAQVERSTVNES